MCIAINICILCRFGMRSFVLMALIYIMKKIFLLVSCIFSVGLFAYSPSIKNWIFPEVKVTKNINLEIKQANTYGFKAYRHSSAMLNITVISLRGADVDTLVTKDYPAFKLRNLPSYSKSFKEFISVTDISDRQEQVIVLYTIKYKSDGHILIVPYRKYIGKGTTNDTFLIQI